MPLSGKEKRALRARGQTLDAQFQVGGAELGESVLAAFRDVFRHRDLIKVRLPPRADVDRQPLLDRLAAAVGAEVVGEVGGTALFYRPLPEKPA
jgi:RNA-binding protein